MKKFEYENYIKKNLQRYLDIDINSLGQKFKTNKIFGGFINNDFNESYIAFELEYLDDYLLDTGEIGFSTQEKIDLVENFIRNLSQEEKNKYLNNYLQVNDVKWEDVEWSVSKNNKGRVYLELYVKNDVPFYF